MEYAGGLNRFLAALIDGVLIMIVNGILGFVGGLVGGDSPAIQGLVSLVSLGIGVAYFAGMESSESQATIGKKAMGLIVTDLDGNRISIGKAILRYLAKILSGCLLLIGYIMILFTEKKQGLHDIIAGTVVVRA